MSRRRTVAQEAAAAARDAAGALERHRKICGPCSRLGKGEAAASCGQGNSLRSYAQLMARQEELLKSPPELEMVQDTLFLCVCSAGARRL